MSDASDTGAPDAAANAAPANAPPADTAPVADAPPAEGEAAPKEGEKPADPPAKPKPKGDWRDDRLRQQTARIASLERERDDALQRVPKEAAPDGQSPTDKLLTRAEFDAAVSERAVQVAQQQAFNADCNRVADLGAKEFGADFQPTLATLWNATDALDAKGNMTLRAVAMLEAAMETDKPHAVLYHLGQNPDEAIRIAALPSDAKRGAALAKLAATLDAPREPPAQSKTPDPIRPLNRGGGNPEPRPDGTQDDYTKWYEKQKKAIGRA